MVAWHAINNDYLLLVKKFDRLTGIAVCQLVCIWLQRIFLLQNILFPNNKNRVQKHQYMLMAVSFSNLQLETV